MSTDNLHSPLWRDIEQLKPTAKGDHRYLLVNQAAFADHMKPINGLSSFERCPLLGQDTEACLDSATPFVMALDGVLLEKGKARALRQLSDAGCYGNALSVIDSNLALREIASALTVRCEAQLPDNYDVLLRFFDTRIMAALTGVLTPAQLSSFFACAHSWRYSDRSGALVQAFSGEGGASDTFLAPLHLSAAQQSALLQAGEADAVIDVLLRNQVEPLLDMPYPERHPTIHLHLAAGGSWGLVSTPDLASYCTLALLHSDGFDQQAPWSELLPAIKRGDISLTEAIATVERGNHGSPP